MELVEGQPLVDLIPAGGLPFDTVVRYGLQIADALAYAHARHVVHRDVKPSNLLVTSEGRIKILDFGLARQIEPYVADRTTQSQSVLVESSALAGTLPYMAPEQLRGEPATPRTDVWSMGIVLYELATGRRPYEGDTPFTLSSMILSEGPRPLPEHVKPGLRKIVLRCLARNPSERYQDAGQVHAALEALEAPADVTTTPHAPASRTIRRPSPRTRVRSLAVLPLDNLSRESDEDYFADGMTDALITTLAQIGALRVISPSVCRSARNCRDSYRSRRSRPGVRLAGPSVPPSQWVADSYQGESSIRRIAHRSPLCGSCTQNELPSNRHWRPSERSTLTTVDDHRRSTNPTRSW